jgi:hypothetical protein
MIKEKNDLKVMVMRSDLMASGNKLYLQAELLLDDG